MNAAGDIAPEHLAVRPGRVFYTFLGHREDVWPGRIFEHVLLGGPSWALGRVDADITPNIDQVAPQANQYQKS